MSKYHVVELEFIDEKALVSAIEELGYKPEIHENPAQLYGYQGDKRKQRAHIVIPRKQVGQASNDVGFEKIDGKYIMHVSAYDMIKWKKKAGELNQLYTANRLGSLLKRKAGTYSMGQKRKKKDGTLQIKLKMLR